MVSWGTRRLLARVHAVRDLDRIMAGYNPKPAGPYDRDPVLMSVCDTWCAGDLAAADWVVRQVWLRERVRRWLRFAPFVLVAVLLPRPIAPLVVLVAGLILTRTSRAALVESTASWVYDVRLRRRMLKRHGRRLPASVLTDTWTFENLVSDSLPPAEREVITVLSPEWHGTVGELLHAAPRLAR